MTLSKAQFKDLHRDLMAEPGVEGGFTVHAETGERPAEGVSVSLPGTEKRTAPASATTPRHLAQYTRTHRQALAEPSTYFGGWKPETDAYTTLDRSRIFKENPAVAKQHGAGVARIDALERAMNYGIAAEQEAVYDLKRRRSYDVR